MKIKPLHIFGFVMSFAYVFFGLLVLSTNFLMNAVSDPTYRKIFGCAILAYGLFRVTFFLRKLREKS